MKYVGLVFLLFSDAEQINKSIQFQDLQEQYWTILSTGFKPYKR